MTVAITTVRERVIAILIAGPQGAGFTDTVIGSNSQPATGRYPDDEELNQAILEADARVITAIIETVGHPYAVAFYTTSGSLANGDSVPAHIGVNALIKVDGEPARLAASMNQLLEAKANPTLYPESDGWAYLENNTLFFIGTSATVSYPNFTMTSACQSPDAYESAVVCGSIGLLMKDGGKSDYYSYYATLYERQEAAIRGQEIVIPQIERLAA